MMKLLFFLGNLTGTFNLVLSSIILFGRAKEEQSDEVLLHLSFRNCRETCTANSSCKSVTYARQYLLCRLHDNNNIYDLHVTTGFVFAANEVVNVPPCHDGWLTFENSCYLFPPGYETFTSAQSNCQAYGGYVVQVETQEENDFLKDTLRGLEYADYWIGMTDEATEGLWKWCATSTVVGFNDWFPGEPNNGGGREHCAVFGDTISYTWADVNCISARKTVCEKPLS